MTSRAPQLIETIRIQDGAAPLWSLHLRRLADSCLALGVPFPPTLLPPEGGEDRVHRLEVGRGGCEITERPLPATPPVRLAVAAVPHRPYPHKTTERAFFETALASAQAAGMDEALLLSEGRGWVAEATRWGLFWWEGERLAAPPLDLGILPGVARMRLGEMAGPIVERRAQLDDILDRGLFLANAARGIVAVATVNNYVLTPDLRSAALAAAFWPRS